MRITKLIFFNDGKNKKLFRLLKTKSDNGTLN